MSSNKQSAKPLREYKQMMTAHDVAELLGISDAVVKRLVHKRSWIVIGWHVALAASVCNRYRTASLNIPSRLVRQLILPSSGPLRRSDSSSHSYSTPYS